VILLALRSVIGSGWFWLAMSIAAAGLATKGWLDEREAFASYRGAVEALNKAAQERRTAAIALDKSRKETADAQNAAAALAWLAAVDRLRRAAGPVGPIVPAAAPGARDPARACFDRAVLEREIRIALEDFRTATRGLVDEGSQARLKLDTALRWAAGIDGALK
jgi:hypothetical protein